MKWLLDTNVVSETAKRRPNTGVIDWLAGQRPDELAVSMITVAELRMGAFARIDAKRRRELLQWIETTVGTWLADRCLPLSVEILTDWLWLARQLAAKRMTRQAPDLLIAATARIHHLTIVTRNFRDFADTGVLVYDPWSDKTHAMDAP